jgi:hypothetical protein
MKKLVFFVTAFFAVLLLSKVSFADSYNLPKGESIFYECGNPNNGGARIVNEQLRIDGLVMPATYYLSHGQSPKPVKIAIKYLMQIPKPELSQLQLLIIGNNSVYLVPKGSKVVANLSGQDGSYRLDISSCDGRRFWLMFYFAGQEAGLNQQELAQFGLSQGQREEFNYPVHYTYHSNSVAFGNYQLYSGKTVYFAVSRFQGSQLYQYQDMFMSQVSSDPKINNDVFLFNVHNNFAK